MLAAILHKRPRLWSGAVHMIGGACGGELVRGNCPAFVSCAQQIGGGTGEICCAQRADCVKSKPPRRGMMKPFAAVPRRVLVFQW